MIQDIGPSVFSNHYAPRQPRTDSFVLFFEGDALPARRDPEKRTLLFPRWREFAVPPRPTYAFSIDGRDYFLALDGAETPQGYELLPIRTLRGLPLASNAYLFTVYSAYHLWRWYAGSRYCGCCGAAMEQDRAERAMFCPACRTKVYPRINPAVIVGVINGDRLLLTKYRTGFAHNALVAGFAEFGETLEETVAREVMEEVGLRVKNIRYYKSQPWGIAADLLAGFFCQVEGDPSIRMDQSELKYAEWVRREDVALQPADYSLTNEMMKLFRDGKEKDFFERLPVPC